MAQTAERRGLARDPDVVAETRRALVSRIVAKEYEDAFVKPADFGEAWDTVLAAKRGRYDHDEMRASAYVRLPAPKGSPPHADAAAPALADQIAAALAPERGLQPQQLYEIAARVAGATKIETARVVPHSIDAGDKHYLAALFAVPEFGRTSEPARSYWGWDI